MNWIQFAIQWLHVLLGIVWFGYTLSMYFLVSPALARLGEGEQRMANFHIGEMGLRVFPIVAPLVILLGFIRGTVFGPIDSVADVFGTGYGVTWLIGLLVALAVLVNGARNIGPGFTALRDAPDFGAATARLARLTQLDLLGFLVIFTCMILMRFGA